MNKCLKIILTGDPHSGFLQNVIQKFARKYGLEGVAQPVDKDKVRIIVCGKKEDVDSFIESMHKESPKESIQDIEIEPFLKDRDYRGVFRVIE